MAELHLKGWHVAQIDDADLERAMLGRWWLSTAGAAEKIAEFRYGLIPPKARQFLRRHAFM